MPKNWKQNIKATEDGKQQRKMIATNRKARHDYELIEKYEAGIVLVGTEVKSLRENNCSLADTFCLVRGGEVWINNLHIAPYSHGNIMNVDSDRRRKLLLHKREIKHLAEKTQEKGLALIPVQMYFDENGRVKVEIALARGKKNYDKRQSLKERDTKREIDRELKNRGY